MCSTPLWRVVAVPASLLDLEAPGEQGDDLDQADERIDRVSRECAGLRPAGIAGVETFLNDAVQLDGLSHDERNGRPEDHDGAGEVPENHLALAPEGERYQHTRNGRHGQHQRDPAPAQLTHTRTRASWPAEL